MFSFSLFLYLSRSFAISLSRLCFLFYLHFFFSLSLHLSGKKELYGEYLVNAQGEDVVAGIRTPKHIDQLKDDLPEVASFYDMSFYLYAFLSFNLFL